MYVELGGWGQDTVEDRTPRITVVRLLVLLERAPR